MEKLIAQIEKVVRKSNLNQMSWGDIVDKVVLPEMAGPRATRWCINDMFMSFVADNAYDIYILDQTRANILFEIALQRLSCGAVLHEASSWPEPLPKAYWDYSSRWDEDHVMTQGCYNFILKAMKICLEHGDKDVRSHALKILFGLIKHIGPDGSVSSSYYHIGKFKEKALDLYIHAKRLVEEYAPFDEVFRNYAQPDQWQKHKVWFADHFNEVDWKQFFAATDCLKGNYFQRMWQWKEIKAELKKLSLPVAK